MRPFYTTNEESEELLALGLDPETADMCYLSQAYTEDGKPSYFARPAVKGKDTEQYYLTSLPCWSLGALMECLPKKGDDGVFWEHFLWCLRKGCPEPVDMCLRQVKRMLYKKTRDSNKEPQQENPS